MMPDQILIMLATVKLGNNIKVKNDENADN